VINLSLIIPFYNNVLELERLLKTIPSNRDIEVIVIDDKSTVAQRKICETLDKFENLNLKAVTNESDLKGAGICRNIGLTHAKGKWILFVDSDDYLTHNFYGIVSNYFDSIVDVVYFTPTSIYPESGAKSKRHSYYEKLISNYLDGQKTEDYVKLKYLFASPCSKMIKNELITKNSIHFDSTLAANDMMFSLKIGYFMNDFHATRDIIYVITDSETSLSKNFSQKHFDARLDVFVRYNKFIRERVNKEESRFIKLNGRHFIRQAIDNRLGILYITKILVIFLLNRIPLLKN
jgi:glycosyltransferase involved in cell wall biosynthesis